MKKQIKRTLTVYIEQDKTKGDGIYFILFKKGMNHAGCAIIAQWKAEELADQLSLKIQIKEKNV